MGKRDVLPFGDTLPEDMTFQQMMDAGVIDIAEIDDVIVCDQAELEGKSFILYEWEVKDSQSFGGEYAICRVKTAEGTRVFADGGSGIKEQLDKYKGKMADNGATGQMLYFHYGLRASHYNKEVDGEVIPATTYYFDNRPRP